MSLGPPPLGPWGASQGGFRPQSTVANPGRPDSLLASKFGSILVSVLGPFGVYLEPFLEVHFGLFGDLVGLSWAQNRLRSVLSSKK